MNIPDQIDFEKLSDHIAGDAYFLQKEKCENLFADLKSALGAEQIQKLTLLYDELFFLFDISDALYYKLGCKKIADIFIGGLI